MAVDQTIQIQYLIEAVDKASATIKKVKKETATYEEAIYKADAATADLTSTWVKMKQIATDTAIAVASVGASFVAYKTYRKSLDLLIEGYVALEYAAITFNTTAFQTPKIFASIGSSISVVSKFFSDISLKAVQTIPMLAKIGDVGRTAFEYVRYYSYLVSEAFTDLIFKSEELTRMYIKVIGFVESLGLKFKEFFNISNLTKSGIELLRDAFGFVIKPAIILEAQTMKVESALKGAGKTTKEVGEGFIAFAKNSELAEKGIFGLVSRAGLAATSFYGLSNLLLASDSVLSKFAGGILFVAAAISGGLAYALTLVVDLIGKFIYSVGTSLVSAMSKAIDKTIKMEQATFAFNFVIKNLNEDMNGTIGSLEEWNQVVDQFTKKMGFSTYEVQTSISEMLRFGTSIGLTKEKMLDLLPVIGDLAVANHKDLFNSTIAVMEGLNGQGMMLQNMGVNLTETALKESKYGQALGKSIQKLTEHEQVALRYQVLMGKTKVTQDLATKSMATMAGQLRLQESVMERVNAAMGVGAQIVEQKVNVAYTAFAMALEDTSKPLLAILGFIGALGGRLLQAIGLTAQWSFTIVLLVTTLKGLNALFENGAINRFLIYLSESAAITKYLAMVNAELAVASQAFLKSIAAQGVSFKTIFELALSVMTRTAAAIASYVAPLLPVAAIIAGIAAALYLLYKAVVVLEQETLFFTKIWKDLVNWWKEIGILDDLKKAMYQVADIMVKGFTYAVYGLAEGFILLLKVIGYLQTKFYEMKAAVRDFTASVKMAYLNFIIDTVNALRKLPDFMLNMIGISSAMASEVDNASVQISNFAKETKGLNEEEKKAIDNLANRSKGLDDLIGRIEKRRDIELGLINVQQSTEKAREAAHKKEMGYANLQINAIKQVKEATSDYYLVLASAGIQNTVKEIANQIEDLTKKMQDAKTEVEKSEFADKLREKLKMLTDMKIGINISEAIGAIALLGKSAAEVFKAAGQVLQKTLLDKKNIKSIQSFINGMTEGPLKVLMKGAFEALNKMIPILGDLIGMIVDTFGASPEVFREKMIALMREIPQLIANIIVNVASMMSGKIVSQMVRAFVESLPIIVKAFGEAIGMQMGSPMFWVDVAVAFVAALIHAIPAAGSAFITGFTDGFRGSFGKIFKGFDFGQIWEGLKKAGQYVYEKLLLGGFELMKRLLSGMGFFKGGLATAIEDAFKKIGIFFQDIFKSIGNFLSEKLGSIWSSMASAFGGIGDLFKGLGQKIVDGFTEAFEKLGSFWKKIFKFDGGGRGAVENFLGFDFPFMAFAKGGLVQGQAVVNGDSPLNDRIPALLSAGEIVIPRSVVNSGQEAIMKFLAGLMPMSGSTEEKTLGSILRNMGLIKEQRGWGGSIGGAISNAVSGVGGAVSSTVNNITDAAGNVVGSVTDSIQSGIDGALEQLSKLGLDIPLDLFRKYREIIKSIMRLGGSINVPQLAYDPQGAVMDAVRTVVGALKPSFKSLMNFPKAENGLIVGGSRSTGDYQMIRANKGEMMITQDQQAKLFKMLHEGMSTGERTINLETTVELDGRTLGKSLKQLQLNGWA